MWASRSGSPRKSGEKGRYLERSKTSPHCFKQPGSSNELFLAIRQLVREVNFTEENPQKKENQRGPMCKKNMKDNNTGKSPHWVCALLNM